MSATSLDFAPIIFSEPPSATAMITYKPIPNDIALTQNVVSGITTLSENQAGPGNAIIGFVYVPDIDNTTACYNASQQYIPTNVTRQRDLPAGRYEHVAVAPWLEPDCVKLYLASAEQQFTVAFVTFLPGTGSANPPNSSADAWKLDGDEQWKATTEYPVYAIPASQGLQILQDSARYSGDITQAPFATNLTDIQGTDQVVRYFATINLNDGSSLPSLWIFLLAVLGVLLGVIGTTSCVMHLLQGHRRRTLRRRIVNGEVDLEALGIKRLTVPQNVLDKMPLYTYGTDIHADTSKPSTDKVSSNETSVTATSIQTSSTSSTTLRPGSYHPSPFQQPTCAICLDDFVPASEGSEGTTVRELPCHHIFHPECVDTFLRDNSSLCPMCKKTVLPAGYCPGTVTNAMVRRERMARRTPPRGSTAEESVDNTPLQSRFSRAMRRRPLSNFTPLRPIPSRIPSVPQPPGEPMTTFSSPEQQPITNPPAALTSPPPPTAGETSSSNNPVQPLSNPRRREWARQRAVAMLGPRHNGVPVDPDAEEAARTPGWRKAIRGIFPGFGVRN